MMTTVKRAGPDMWATARKGSAPSTVERSSEGLSEKENPKRPLRYRRKLKYARLIRQKGGRR